MSHDAINWFLILLLGLAALFLAWSLQHALAANNSFVQMLERREGMFPGQTKVLQECSCTVRYLGTTVHGNIYDVRLQKLD